MAYTNVVELLLLKLQILLFTEFGGSVPVFFGEPGNERAAEWFELRLLSSAPVDEGVVAFGECRRYQLEILYLRPEGAEADLTQQMERLEMAERMHRFLTNNTAVASYWFNGKVGAIDYAYRPLDRADDKLLGVRFEYGMTYFESIS